MTVPRNGRISQLSRPVSGRPPARSPASSSARPRSRRSQGLRTLQHQSLSRTLCDAVDTEVWFRGLILAAQDKRPTDRRWATKDQVYDEALGWFLEHHAAQPLAALATRAVPLQDLTFWLDSRLLERARRLAARDSIKLAHLIEHALVAYVRRHIPEPLLQFRRRTRQQAKRLYERHRSAPGARRERRAKRR